MPLDPSISLQAGTGAAAPSNPLAQIGQITALQSQINQNKMFPGQLQQQQNQLALFPGQLQQQQNQLAMFPGAIQGQQLGIAQAQLEQTQNRRAAVIQNLTPILADPNVTHAKLMSAIGGLKASGLPTDEIVNDFAQNMPAGDGSAFQGWAKNFAARSLPSTAAVEAVGNSPTEINTGLGVQGAGRGGILSGSPGALTPSGQRVDVFPSRAEQAQRVQVGVDSNGAPIYAPQGAVTPRSLSGMNLGSGKYSGSVPDGLRNPNGPAVPPPPGTPLPGQTTNGIGPGRQSEMVTNATNSANHFQDISNSGIAAKGLQAQLGNMENDLGGFTTGTGSEKVLDAKRAIQSWAPGLANFLGVDPSKITSQESFEKLANQIADAQHIGSDARLQVNQAANPHVGLSPDGAKFIIHQLQGNADYNLARQQMAAAYPDKTDAQGFEAKSSANLDPRWFQFNRLAPDEQRQYLNNIPTSKGQRDAFKQRFMAARNQGLLGTSDAGQ